jgi:hypothetical protein
LWDADAEDIDDSENDDPDAIDEMPIVGNGFDMLGVVGVQTPPKGGNEDSEEEEDADDHMEGVQANEGVKCGAKGICGEGEVFFENEMVPFRTCEVEEVDAKSRRDSPPEREARFVTGVKAAFGQKDRAAAAEKGDCAKEWEFQHFMRIRAVEAFPHVEKIGYDEDREESRLG